MLSLFGEGERCASPFRNPQPKGPCPSRHPSAQGAFPEAIARRSTHKPASTYCTTGTRSERSTGLFARGSPSSSPACRASPSPSPLRPAARWTRSDLARMPYNFVVFTRERCCRERWPLFGTPEYLLCVPTLTDYCFAASLVMESHCTSALLIISGRVGTSASRRRRSSIASIISRGSRSVRASVSFFGGAINITILMLTS